MNHIYQSAVVFLKDQSSVSLWTENETEPVVAACEPNETSALLFGIQSLLEFAVEEQYHHLNIHLNHLHTFNIMNRYMACWKRQDWHTSRNQPVPNLATLQAIDALMSRMQQVTFQNVSPQFQGNPYIQRAKGNFTSPKENSTDQHQ